MFDHESCNVRAHPFNFKPLNPKSCNVGVNKKGHLGFDQKKAIIMVIVVNADECMLTHLQEMSLDYHFCLEQEVGSSTYTFFRFNGEFLLASRSIFST